MSNSPDTLLFRFPAHTDSILMRMNAMREELRFCDITLLIGGPPGATAQPLCFHGHRVVFAASSDFLRDQFLLHEGHAELNVGVVPSTEVGKRLLLSCYTGLLEVPLTELVSYLTAASALQMVQVAEKCAEAVSQYLCPTLAFLTMDQPSREEGTRQPESSQQEIIYRNEEESGAAQPGIIKQEVDLEDCTSKPGVSQGHNADIQRMREVRDDRREVLETKDLSEVSACCLDVLNSVEGGEIQPVHKLKTSYQADRIALGPRCRLHFPIQACLSPKTGGSSANHEQLLQSYTKQNEEGDRRGDEAETITQRPYLCRRCDRVFQDLSSYLGHLKEHRQYLCLVCGEGFSQKSSLSLHIQVHTGAKLFRCPLCHKTFFHKATLQDHLNVHTGDKPHKCHYCAVHFAHKLGLRRHLKGMHGKGSLQNITEETVN
ncbi:zinc finger and BTB domain-containing protein 26-like [Xyrichtys novacula]|uniref:Zinc finger and BTB domain-containing protein 26-like n=1 Tax=Xyrichtys novacula TaxID=13765 RepID=A0AAV1GBQ7_XYRNO|nr:zinc finger and BTB domain-containing protein 26-like [Xyrichtys novacula]